MKKKLIIFGLILLALVMYIVNLLSTAGHFRTIENRLDGEIIARVDLVGAEDMTVSEDGGFLVISSFDRFSEKAGNWIQGGIYFMDLEKDSFQVQLLTKNIGKPFYPHGLDMIRLDSNRHRLFVINHVGEANFVEVFTLYGGDSLVHDKTLSDPTMFSPNDIVAISDNQFYFTNDKNSTSALGKLGETYLGFKRCRVTYFDGQKFRNVVTNGKSYTNGIKYDAKRNFLYVSSSRSLAVDVYLRAENGDLTFVESLQTNTGLDNIELDKEGNLWIGCHPKLLAFLSYSQKKQAISPSEIIKIKYDGAGKYETTSVFLDDGSNVSATSTAAVYKDLIFTGNVMDDHFLVLKRK
jgi:arylesterase / paraoxonase